MIDLYPNETFITLWAIFLVVLFFLHHWVFKPTLKIIEARKGQTHVLQDSAQKLLEKNKNDLESYEKKIAAARHAAALERDRIVKEARVADADIIAKARAEAEAMVNEMQVRLSREREESLDRLNKYAIQMAKEASDKILERVA